MFCYTGKYLYGINATSYYDLPCTNKSDIAYIWEADYFKNIQDQEQLYGCLNRHCRDVFGEWLNTKLLYLCLMAVLLFLAGLASTLMAYRMHQAYGNTHDKVLYHHASNEGTFIAVTAAIIIAGAFVCYFCLPAAPNMFPYTESNLKSSSSYISVD